MKSEDRHRLETNVMAEHLAEWIEKLRPYAASAAGIALFIFIAMFAWSYLSSSSATWQSQAWDAYNQAVATGVPNMTLLRETAQEYPGTKMQEMADITWADGQVINAVSQYLTNRPAAMDALSQAAGEYQSVLQASNDPQLQNRARLGLARVYEMQNQLDKARDEYLKVTGGWAEYAKSRAKELEQPSTKETYAWLSTAEAPRRPAPSGPGSPGKAPAFSAGDVPLPGTAPTASTSPAAPADAANQAAPFGDLLQGLDLDLDSDKAADRYGTETTAPATENKPTGEGLDSSESPSDDEPK